MSFQIDEFVRDYEQQWERSSPLSINAFEGKLTRGAVEVYLQNILYLIQHTPIHLRFAMEAAERKGHKLLCAFFAEKIEEEQGHDKWAEADLLTLNATPNAMGTR